MNGEPKLVSRIPRTGAQLKPVPKLFAGLFNSAGEELDLDADELPEPIKSSRHSVWLKHVEESDIGIESLPFVKYSDKVRLPKLLGVYFVVFYGEVYYVGMTLRTLRARWANANYKFQCFCEMHDPEIRYLPIVADPHEVRALERLFINKYQSPFNGEPSSPAYVKAFNRLSGKLCLDKSGEKVIDLGSDRFEELKLDTTAYDAEAYAATGVRIIPFPDQLKSCNTFTRLEIGEYLQISQPSITRYINELRSIASTRFNLKSRQKVITSNEAIAVAWLNAVFRSGVSRQDIHTYCKYKRL